VSASLFAALTTIGECPCGLDEQPGRGIEVPRRARRERRAVRGQDRSSIRVREVQPTRVGFVEWPVAGHGRAMSVAAARFGSTASG